MVSFFFLFLVVFVAIHSLFSTIVVFNRLNFSEWKEQIKFYLGVIDLDLTFREEKPNAIIDESTDDEKNHFKNWERSNRLSLMYMRISITSNKLICISFWRIAPGKKVVKVFFQNRF